MGFNYTPVGKIPAHTGFRSPADDYVENKLDLNELLIAHPAATFFVRADGDLMRGANIHPGDILIVDRAVEPYDGAIIIACLNSEFTVKRIKYAGSSKNIFLVSESKYFKPIRVTKDHDFQVWGVVTYVIHKTVEN